MSTKQNWVKFWNSLHIYLHLGGSQYEQYVSAAGFWCFGSSAPLQSRDERASFSKMIQGLKLRTFPLHACFFNLDSCSKDTGLIRELCGQQLEGDSYVSVMHASSVHDPDATGILIIFTRFNSLYHYLLLSSAVWHRLYVWHYYNNWWSQI